MYLQVALLVKLELKKLLEASFIWPMDYSNWISNIVPVGKPIGGIFICINFRDLNKAFPKDDLALLNIDILVDLIVVHAMLY